MAFINDNNGNNDNNTCGAPAGLRASDRLRRLALLEAGLFKYADTPLYGAINDVLDTIVRGHLWFENTKEFLDYVKVSTPAQVSALATWLRSVNRRREIIGAWHNVSVTVADTIHLVTIV